MPRAPKAKPPSQMPTRDSAATGQGRWADGGNTGSRARTTTAEHRAMRDRVLREARWLCQLSFDGCTRRATVYDHHVSILVNEALTKKKLPEWVLDHRENAYALCTKCSRRKSSAEGHWVQCHTLKDPFNAEPWNGKPYIDAVLDKLRDIAASQPQTSEASTPRVIGMSYTTTETQPDGREGGSAWDALGSDGTENSFGSPW